MRTTVEIINTLVGETSADEKMFIIPLLVDFLQREGCLVFQDKDACKKYAETHLGLQKED